MSKYQRAFGIIDTILHLMCGIERKDGYRPTQDEMKESMIILKKLVERATPLPPEKEERRLSNVIFHPFVCPICSSVVKDVNYCPNCGQALSWGEEDE